MAILKWIAATLLASTIGLTTGSPLVKRNGTCTTKNQRKAWHNLSNTEKAAYIDAELCLMSSPPKLDIEGALNRWDEVMYAHVVQSNIIHDVGAFLPWHRLYMRAHEILLQTECNYTGAQPYWEEVLDVTALNESSVFDPDTGFGGNGVGDDGCVADGPFQNLTLHINQTSNYANYCLSRDFSSTSFQTANQTYIDACYASGNYSEAWQCYKKNPHTAGHAGVGGTVSTMNGGQEMKSANTTTQMLDVVASPGDSVNLPSRLTDMTGRNIPLLTYLEQNDFTYPGADILDYDGDPGNVTTLNHNLWMVGLIPNATIADVMDLGGETICAEYV